MRPGPSRSVLAVMGVMLLPSTVLSRCGGDGDGMEAPGEARIAPAAAKRGCARPYAASSPWNTPIGGSPRYHPRSRHFVSGLRGRLTSDPTQYTYPVYDAESGTERRRLRIAGVFSNVVGGGRRLVVRNRTSTEVPIPADARAAAGSDAQVVILDGSNRDEWGAWMVERAGGGFAAENGYHYNTRWSGVPPTAADGRTFGSRGAGVPYLAGLVRPCEIARRRISHALAFAYDNASPRHVYPATKSDGSSGDSRALPQGSRLQLDPGLSAGTLRRWGCRGACLTVARALQRYGLYLIDNSGRPKVMFEYEGTAHWRGTIDEGTVSPIRMSAFRLLLPERGG